MPSHLKGVGTQDIGEVVLLVGDPDRVRRLSETWVEGEVVAANREFVFAKGIWKGRLVSACSTGIGLGSTEIAILELAELGADVMVRVGGCGAWHKGIRAGELVINHAMAKEPGLMDPYVQDGFPGAADPVLTHHLLATAREYGYRAHYGIGLTTKYYYLGQGRLPNLKRGPDTPSVMDYWGQRSVINCDMESAVLFTLASIYGLHAANCLVVHGNRLTNEWCPDDQYAALHLNVSDMVLAACFRALGDLRQIEGAGGAQAKADEKPRLEK